MKPALIICPLLLAGCIATDETRATTGERTVITERHATPDGGFVERVHEVNADNRTSQSRTGTDVEFGALLSKGVAAAATGDWAALAITGGTALMAGAAAVSKHREAQAHKADADDAWNRLLDQKDKA